MRSPWFAMMITVPCYKTQPLLHDPTQPIESNRVVFAPSVRHSFQTWHHPILSNDPVRGCQVCSQIVAKSFWPKKTTTWVHQCGLNDSEVTDYWRTFLNSVPSLQRGTEGKERSGFMTSDPFRRLYKLLIMMRRSEVVFTGRKRARGTLTPAKTNRIILDSIVKTVVFLTLSDFLYPELLRNFL